MAVEQQIVALLRADADVNDLVGSRIYDMPAPQGTASPFVTYQMIGSSRTGQTYGATAAYDVTGVQVDCWCDDTATTSAASRSDQVRDLARAVRTALHGRGLSGEDTVDLIRFDGWTDFNTPSEARRSLDFTLMVRGF